MLAVTANNNIVVADSPPNTEKRFEYTYKPYETGVSYTEDTSSAGVRVEVDEDSSIATMIASEDVLARDWDTPEEDEAWENL